MQLLRTWPVAALLPLTWLIACGDDTGGGASAEGGATGEGGSVIVCEYLIQEPNSNCNTPCTALAGQETQICTKECDPMAADPGCFEQTECAEGDFEAYCLEPCGAGCPSGTRCDMDTYVGHCVAE